MYSVIVFDWVRSKLLRSSLAHFLIAPLFFVGLFLLVPKADAQTNLIYCYVQPSTGQCRLCPEGICTSGPNPDCAPGYVIPAVCHGDADSCCDGLIPCETRECVFVQPAPQCPSGYTCTGLDAPICQQGGGLPRDCSTLGGSPGICCESQGAPAPQCPSNRPLCTDVGSVGCRLAGGATGDCSTPSGQPGTCCKPPPGNFSQCPQNQSCISLDRQECTRAGFTAVDCSTPEGVDGSCCAPDTTIAQGGFYYANSECNSCVQEPPSTNVSRCQTPYEYDSFGECCEARLQATNCGSYDLGYGYYYQIVGSSGRCTRCTQAQYDAQFTGCWPNPELSSFEACCNVYPNSLGCEWEYGPHDPYADQNLPNRWDQLFEAYGIEIEEVAGTIYDILFPIGLAIGLFSIIIAGYAFMTSQGQPDKVKEAKEKLTAAVVGILFIVLSIVILRVIIRTLLDPTYIL